MAPAMAKPGRSEDAQMDAEQQARLAEAIRQKLAAEAPRRPLKPSRSEDVAADIAAAPYDGPIPEHLKLQQLLETSPAQAVIQDFAGDVPLEFVETEYYKDLRAADQTLHHTTGSGFIQVPANKVVDLSSLPDAPIVKTEVSVSQHDVVAPEEFVETEYYKDLNAVDKSLHHTTGSGFIQVEKNSAPVLDLSSSGLTRTKSGCNPATNDWIPAESTMEMHASEKPRRSEP
ncbi:hypothetical protein GOP47_0008704 [Adiantum capillus-veneris]|uniref:Uncharacterized protein n=1 Tax=Adiantum capillus-veneris TaxID=13818 RepID=A0A9D4UZ36_ADICA|nr:hypothetical protein GOP47_0008704 [Adiantum capillus-veneris]